MEAIYNIALFTHIAGGGIALLAGFFAMIARKGGSGHAKTGYTFYFSTLAVALTALFMAVYSNKPFLLHIGLFTLYQNLAGMRSVRIKSLRPAWLDWILALVGISIMLIILKAKKIVSISSITGYFMTFVLSLFLFIEPLSTIGMWNYAQSGWFYSLAIFVLWLIIVYRHKENIQRLIRGEELDFKKKKK
jgi:glycerol-3-phosphate acyltransferase PlsY